MSIQTRLTVAVALVLALTFGLLGVVQVRNTRATLVDQVDQQVRENAMRNMERVKHERRGDPYADGKKGDRYGRDFGRDGRVAGAAETAVATPAADGTDGRALAQFVPFAQFVFSSSGQLVVDEPCGYTDDPKPRPQLPTIPSPEADTLMARNRIVTTPAADGTLSYRMLLQRGPADEVVVTAAPLAEVDAAVSQLVWLFFGAGAIALMATTLASWWLIRRGLRPVDQMIDTAAAIAGGDLGRRVPDADPRTELGKLGGALNEMLGQIERAVRAREASEGRLRRFVADAAHELRTPLTSLRGYAELYRQGALPDTSGVDNAMRRIEAEGARMAHLVDDLLLLARLDQHRGLETKPVDLVDVVDEALADFAAVDPNRPLTSQLVDTAVVAGDRIRLRQVIDNLLANARTHTPPGTPVHVAVRRRGGRAEIEVRDEGPGIAPEDQARVFERFWRADPARARNRGGTGLGLAIVASLVAAHDGTVDVASEPGRGTTFTVRLPLRGDDRDPRPAPPAAPRGPSGRTPRLRETGSRS